MAAEEKHTDRFDELCSAYVLDALTEEERCEFEGMLKRADDQQLQLYHEMRQVGDHLAASVRHEEPPPKVKNQLMSRIRERTKPSSLFLRITTALKLDKPQIAISAFMIMLIIVALLAYLER